MKINRKRNAKINVISGIINKLIVLFMPFAVRTVLIYKLGNEYLGLNSLFTSIIQVLSLSELGFGSAMVFEMYKPISEDDTKLICCLLNLYKKIYFAIGSIVLSIGIIIMPFLKYLINGGYPQEINIYILYILYLFNSVVSYFLFAYKEALFSAHQKTSITYNIHSLVNIALYICQIIILVIFNNYYIYVLTIPFTTAIYNIVVAIMANKQYPQYKCAGILDRDYIKSIRKKVFALFGHKLGGIVINSADSIVISSFLGLIILGQYNNYYYILSAVSGIVSVLFSSMTAGIGNSIITEKKEKNIKDFFKILFMFSWIIGWCSSCLLCLYQPFVEMWIGKENLFPFYMVVLFTIYFYIKEIRDVVLTYKDAAGMWWADRFKPYVTASVNLSLNILLVIFFDNVWGVVLSSIMAMLVISLPWEANALFKKYFNISTKKYYTKITKYTIVNTIVISSCYYLCTLIILQGLIGFIFKLIFCVIYPNIIYIIFYRNSYEFKQIKVILISLIKNNNLNSN